MPSGPLRESVTGSSRYLDSVRITTHHERVTSPTSDITRALRRAGLNVTAQRLAVHEAVRACPHAVADEIADRVRLSIGTVSRQAVYDALALMVELGLVRRIQPAGSPARYEVRVDNHHHLVCRRCGATLDIDCAVGAAPCLVADDDHGYVIDEAEVIYWGTCPACRKDGERAKDDIRTEDTR